ncbi:hypothetical protein QE400_003544 [Xanthomonas sacchari]|uniref:hypothetical protein n=1 Tax=Xanthomonas sacchari TaxID=56458 RepID=UPI00277D9A81|nr:hypothetical protein [Xanthomonas sacchari]MDQ1094131.1 hypothetical protein [Xanthomonas sacchari]
MRIIDLPSMRLPAGHLTVWRVCDGTAPRNAWTHDPRRASHAQEAAIRYMREEASQGRRPPSWLGCLFDLPAALDLRAFAAALRAWIDRHEVLRSQLGPRSRTAAGCDLQRTTLPVGNARVHASEAGMFADAAALGHYLEQLFDSEVGPLAWPGYLATSIAHAAATTVCIALDHTLVDGYSLLQIPQEIHTLYAAACATREASPVAAGAPLPSYLDFAEAERTAADALTVDHPHILRWRRFVTDGKGALPAFPLPVRNPDGCAAAQPSGYADLLDAASTRAFECACRTAGGDSFSGVLACLALANLEIAGSPEFSTMLPFNTQPPPRRPSLGWYVGMGPVTFALEPAGGFEQAVRCAAAALDGIKALAQIPIPRVMELLGQPLRDPFMVSYMDLRLIGGARHWNAWNAVALRSRITDPEEVCLWIMRTHDGLNISYRHPANAAADAIVADYVARSKRILACVADTTH